MTSGPVIPGAVVLISGDDHNGKSSLIDSYECGRLCPERSIFCRDLAIEASLPMDEPLDFGRVYRTYEDVESKDVFLSPRWRDWNTVSDKKRVGGHNLRVNITFQDDTIGVCQGAHVLRPLTYYSAAVIALCFSVIRREALDYIPHRWAPELRHWVPHTPIVLIGTMTDLRDPTTNLSLTEKFGACQEPRRAISTEEGRRMARQIGAIRYVECSASRNINIQETFAMLAMLAGENLLLMKKKEKLRDKVATCIIA